MFKNFLMKQMVKRQMKGIPEEQQEVILGAIEKNPTLFTRIAHDVQERVKGGMSQQDAMNLVMKANEAELKQALNK